MRLWMLKRRGDEGATLVVALLIITVVAFVTGALLTLSDGSFRATLALRQAASDAYASDAAAKLAIDNIEGGYSQDPSQVTPLSPATSWVYNNSGFDGCFGNNSSGKPVNALSFNDVMPAVGTAKASSAYVSCAIVPGTGIYGSAVGQPIPGTGGSSGASGTAQALLTDGSGTSTDGLTLTTRSNTAFRVRGSVDSWSTLSINPNNGALVASGDVNAVNGSCSQVTSINGTCGTTKVAVANAYDTRTPTLTWQAVPSCVGGTATFSPGYYNDAVALSAVTTSCAVNWFQPGTYYFDFHNNTNDATYSHGAMTAGSDVWNIGTTGSGTINLIGGTKSSAFPAVPGGCLSPIDSAAAGPNTGVQFVFGGDSRVSLGNNAQVDLCASTATAARPVAIYGMTGQPATATAASSPVTLTPTSTSTVTPSPVLGTVNATYQALQSPDGNAATYTTAAGGTNVWTLTTTGFDSISVPAGSLLKSAQIVVRHQEPATNGNAPVVKVNGQTVAGTTLSAGAWKTDTLTPGGTSAAWDAISSAVENGTLNTLPISVAETMKTGTEAVDSVNLVLTYYPPTPRNLGVAETVTGTVVSPGTPDISNNCLPASCNFWLTGQGSSYKGTFYTEGATYVPNGAFNIGLGNQSLGDAFRYGLISWGLNATMLNNYPQSLPVVSIPDEGPSFGRNVTVVDLTVYVCTQSDTCAQGSGTKALTARVEFTDPTTTVSAPNTRQISILSWAEQK